MHDEPAETFYDPLAEGARPLPPPGSWTDASRGLPSAPVPLAAKFFLWAGLFWFFIALAAGLTYALQFVAGWGDALIPLNEAHSPARMRMSHTSIMIYGFILNVFFAGMFGTTDADDPAAGRRALFGIIGWVGFQTAVVWGNYDVLYGRATELPWVHFSRRSMMALDAGFVWTLGSYLFLSPHASKFGGALPFFFFCAALAGWILPDEVLVRSQRSLFQVIEDPIRIGPNFQSRLLFLVLFPLCLGVMMRWTAAVRGEQTAWILPFALIAFLTAVYLKFPGNDAYAPGLSERSASGPPVLFQTEALRVFLAALGGIVAGLALAFRKKIGPGGAGDLWFWFGIAAAALFLIERILLTLPGFGEQVRYTDWIVAHHHTLFAGVFGSWCFALIDWMGPRARGAESWRWPELALMHFLLTAAALALMIFALELVGWRQSLKLSENPPWAAMLQSSRPFWIIRVIAGVVLVLAQGLLLANVIFTRPARTAPGAEGAP